MRNLFVFVTLFNSIKTQMIFPTERSMQRQSGPLQNNKVMMSTTNNLIPEPDVCGVFDIITRIHGGNETEIEEYPWLALLEYSENNVRKGFRCGGSLINNRYVITAAHCLAGSDIPKNWHVSGVRLGEWDTSTDQDCVILNDNSEICSEAAVNIAVQKIIVHENYKPTDGHQYNDIALLRLEHPVKYSKWISPICLPSSRDLRNSNFKNEMFNVAGWGRTEYGSKSDIKLKAAITTYNKKSCKAKYSAYNIHLADSQICAGGVGGIDTCRGDSGGPLIGFGNIKPESENFYLAGIISFGPNPCGLDGWPGIYTRVGSFIDWIQANVKP